MKTNRKIVVAGVLAMLCVVMMCLLIPQKIFSLRSARAESLLTTEAIVRAVKAYQQTGGKMPATEAELIEVLIGSNDEHVSFLDPETVKRDKNGAILDGYRKPLRIKVTPTLVIVQNYRGVTLTRQALENNDSNPKSK